MLIGYMRPSQEDPNCEMQHSYLTEINCQTIISEEHSSAKKRVQLHHMLDYLNQGDKIVITKLFTIADSTRHLVEVLDVIAAKGAHLHSISEGIDTSRTSGYSFNEVAKHLLEFQSDVISERTKQGIDRAKKKGATPGRPRKPDENVTRAIIMYQSKKYSLAEIKAETGISKSTLYRYLEN